MAARWSSATSNVVIAVAAIAAFGIGDATLIFVTFRPVQCAERARNVIRTSLDKETFPTEVRSTGVVVDAQRA